MSLEALSGQLEHPPLGAAALPGDGVSIAGERIHIKPVPLTRNFVWTLAGNVTYAACQWGIFLVLARLSGPEMVGKFALGFAVANPVILLSQFQLRALQATDASHKEFRPGDYFSLRLVTTLLAIGVIAAIAIGAGYRRETAWVVVVAGTAKAFDSLSDVFYGHLQQHEHMKQIARSMILRGVLSLCALGVVVWSTGSAVSGAIALAASWALILIIHDVPVARAVGSISTRLRWNSLALGRLLVRAFPLGVVTMLASLDSNIPRYFIAHHLGERALGLFAGIASLQGAGMVLVNAMGQSAAPRLARYHLLGDHRAFWSLLRRMLAIASVPGALLIGGALLAGNAVPRLLFGPAYAHEQSVFVWLTLSMAIWFLASVLGYGATASRRIHFQPYALAAVAVTTLSVCLFAVPRYGILGGAIASAASAVVGCLFFTAGFLLPANSTELVEA